MLGFSIFGLDYNTAVVLSGTGLLGMAAGIIGSFAVLRRRALLGDALAHAALPGICIAFLIVQTRSFPVLLLGALVSVSYPSSAETHARRRMLQLVSFSVCFLGQGLYS